MKRIFTVGQDYSFLRNYIEDIPENFDTLGKLIQSNRNVIREDFVDGKKLVIKSYRRIYLPNRIRYTYFYPSKAQRAFDYAKILLQKGFHTPQPIAYIEIIQNGLINQSYFISEYSDFQPLDSIRQIALANQGQLLREVAL